GALPGRALAVPLGPSRGGDGLGVLGAEDPQRLAAEIDVVAAGRGRRPDQRAEERLRRARSVIVHVVRALRSAHGHRALVPPEATLGRERLPRRGFLVLGHAVRELPRVTLRRAGGASPLCAAA